MSQASWLRLPRQAPTVHDLFTLAFSLQPSATEVRINLGLLGSFRSINQFTEFCSTCYHHGYVVVHSGFTSSNIIILPVTASHDPGFQRYGIHSIVSRDVRLVQMHAMRQSCRPKHQVLILKCYPKFQKTVADVKPNPSELSYLLYYVSTRRSKLQKVGQFLERRTSQDVYKGRVRYGTPCEMLMSTLA